MRTAIVVAILVAVANATVLRVKRFGGVAAGGDQQQQGCPAVSAPSVPAGCNLVQSKDQSGCTVYSLQCPGGQQGQVPDAKGGGQLPQKPEPQKPDGKGPGDGVGPADGKGPDAGAGKEPDATELCPPVEPAPSPTPECREYTAVHDERYCIIGYECGGGEGEGEEEEEEEVTTMKPKVDCKYLDPNTNADIHPKSDKSCKFGLPGWTGEPDCRCTYPVKERDKDGCPSRYYALCSRKGKAPATCPPVVFPPEKEGCTNFLTTDENDCKIVEQDCGEPPDLGKPTKPDGQQQQAIGKGKYKGKTKGMFRFH